MPGGTWPPACQRAATQGIVYVVLVRSVAGHAGSSALARHVREYRDLAYQPGRPTALVNFGESVNFPLLFGAALSLFGIATMAHLLLVSVARRRAEVGLLKVLGFVRRQVVAVVCWQAVTATLVGIVIGAPLGVAAGRLIWHLFATDFGVVPVSVVHLVPLAVLAALVLVAAIVLACVPALVAARSRPARLLRAE